MKQMSSVPIQKIRPLQNTHSSFKFMLVLAQCFALIPVTGILSLEPSNLGFRKRSFQFIHAVMAILVTSFVAFMSLYDKMKTEASAETSLGQTVTFLFYAGSAFTMVLFITLANKWPQLMAEWTNVDLLMMKSYGYPKYLDSKLKMISVITVLLAAAEHISSLLVNATYVYNNNNSTITAKLYYTSAFGFVFIYIDFSYWMASLVQAANALSTFVWNFNDLFIVLISVPLAARFKQITERLQQNRNRISDKFWTEIREDYNRLSNLCDLVDSAISDIVLTSYATNIFFVILQLFNTLRVRTLLIEKVYFFLSFGFLILRVICVSLYAASVNGESKKPTSILNSVAASVYNTEIQRFLLQLRFDNVALTGSGLFRITGALMLYVAGAIVSYELVFIQFNTTGTLY